MKSRILMCGLSCLFSFQVNAQTKTRIADLSGYWKFSIGSQDSWAGYHFNDASWENIRVPSPWENQGFYGYNGFAFYRKEVYISSDHKGSVFSIDLGYIDDVDNVYFNGESIGSTGSFPPHFSSAYNAHREYFIPEEIIKFNQKNVIAVKIYDSHAEGGIVGGNPAIFAQGQSVKMDINLQGRWKFKPGDHPDYKNILYSDKNWSSIFVPSHWEDQGYKDFDGIAWYRYSFTYNQLINDEKLVILMGKIDDIDEVYINGNYVGSTGYFNARGRNDRTYEALRGYIFSSNLLKKNQVNVIAVRVQDYVSGGGIYEGPVGIMSHKKYIEYWRNKANAR